jgi:FAD binding domain/Berberine and berberine like
MSIERAAFQELAGELAGKVVLAEDAGYEVARRVWNGMIDKRPAGIVRCAGSDDVLAVTSFAKAHGLAVAVRAGGHNIAGNGTCDGGIVVDLSPLNGVEVDQSNRRARVGGGTTISQLDVATQRFGLATTGGIMPTTGVGGFTLGGGLGVLMRSYGLACDNLLSAEVVTADGRRLRASATENTDLFWGLRGGGGNFGVVTSFEFQLHEVGPLLTARIAHPWSKAREALRFFRDFLLEAPDGLVAYLTLGTHIDGQPAVFLRGEWNGPISEGESVVAPLRRFGSPIRDDCEPMLYVDVQKIVEPAFPPDRLNYWKANFVEDLSDELIDVMIDSFSSVPSPYSMIALEQMGGAVARVPDSATAFQSRNAAFSLLILSGWVDPADSDVNVAWTRDVWERTQPLSSSGVYVNYLGTEGEGRVRAAYGVNHARLTEIKRKYDPQNFFRLNQNIEPAAT